MGYHYDDQQPGLFPIPDPDFGEEAVCEKCLTHLWCSVDGLRARGWLAFDGLSLTGDPLHVRICPNCQQVKD